MCPDQMQWQLRLCVVKTGWGMQKLVSAGIREGFPPEANLEAGRAGRAWPWR